MTPRRSLSERAYAALLRLYPADFRRAFGDDMHDLFRDHLRAARRRSGWRGVLLLWLRAIPDLLLTSLHHHEEHMLNAIGQDARYAGRVLRKNPVFTLVAIAVVALGTGAVSTIFSVANAVVLRPIPGVARPSEVVAIERVRADGGGSRSASYPFYKYLAANAKTMRGIAATDMLPITIGTSGEGILAQANLVSGNYFDVLGARPQLGRFFVPDEDQTPNAKAVVVISDELWHRRFSGESSVVGRDVLVNGTRFTVIGVAPRKFNGIYPIIRIDAWIPMMMQPVVRRGGDLLHSVGSGWLEMVGRVAPTRSRAEARTELGHVARQFSASNEVGGLADLARFSDVRLSTMMGIPTDANAPVLAFFAVLVTVSALVLMIASVNVASMLLARAIVRRREIAVRIALGAARRRIIRQLLTESLILFAAGGALGVVVAFYGTRLLSHIPLPADVPIVVDASPDGRVIVATLVVSLLTGIIFGLAPAVQGSSTDIATSLRGDGAAAGRSRSRLRNTLVAAQVAASLVLLTTSGLFVRALARGHRVDPGYDIHNVVTASFDVSLSGYDATRARAFYAALRDRIAALPGVTASGYARTLPLSMNTTGLSISLSGSKTASGRGAEADVSANFVDGGYFDALRLPIIAGRAINPTDDAHAPAVAVVSRAFADRFWPGSDAVGRTFQFDSTTITIVGIVRDVKFARLDEPREPFLYLPLAQQWRPDVNLVVRTSDNMSVLIGSIRAEARALDRSLPAAAPLTLEQTSAVVLLPQRFAVIVTAALGAAGLLLAAIGLYGVISFSTARRSREIGVRMALGASRADVLSMVVREGMRVVVIGVVIGLVLAAAGTRLLAPFLFGVSPLDLATYVTMTGILLTIAFVASLVPARRAARANPMAALRQD